MTYYLFYQFYEVKLLLISNKLFDCLEKMMILNLKQVKEIESNLMRIKTTYGCEFFQY